MEKQVVISENQQITTVDLNRMGQFATDSIDHLVYDAVEPLRKLTGFQVTQSATAQVTVSPGRLYSLGKVYFRDDDGGVTIDLLSLLPAVVKKVVAIVTWPDDTAVVTDTRTFLVDADTEQTEARINTVYSQRIAKIDRVAGLESADPVAPALDANVIAIAYVTLTPAGIESIVRATDNVLVSTSALDGRMKEQEAFRVRAGSRLDTLDSNLSALRERIVGLATRAQISEIARDVARLKELSELPDNYTSYGADRFLDTEESDTEHVDFLAKVQEGIRFPPASQREAQILLANPIDPSVSVTNNFVLPAYTEVERYFASGRDGEIAISQYQYQTLTSTQYNVARERIRYGGSMTVCTNSAWWNSGRYDSVGNTFRINGETWLVGELVANYGPGHEFFRVTQYWVDTFYDTYWSVTSSDQAVSGASVAQTFLCGEDGYLTGVSLPFTRVAATGDVRVLLVNTVGGKPDIESVVASAVVSAANMKIYPELTKVQFAPTLLQKGRRYGLWIITGGNHYIGYVANSKDANGTLFYSTDGAWFAGDLTRDIPFTAHFARFSTPRLEVQLQPLQLEGGIKDIDILYDKLGPATTDAAGIPTTIQWEVQVAGIWKPLSGSGVPVTNGLPPLLPFRAVLIGTTEVMPGFGIGVRSQLLTERPRSDYVHISTARTLPSPCETVEVTVRLEGWDPSRHTAVCTLLVGSGYTTVEASDVTEDTTTEDPAAIYRKWTFNLATARSSYKIKISGTTNNVLVTHHVAERYDLAFT